MSEEARQIECAMRERRTVEGTLVEGHRYRDTEKHEGCTVIVSVCENCGKVDVGWYYTDKPPMKISPPTLEPK